MLTPASGMNGTTSTAPSRGCSPLCVRMSTSLNARSTSACVARTTASGSPAYVKTERLWSTSLVRSRRRTPSTARIVSASRSMTSARRPSLTFGTHSTRRGNLGAWALAKPRAQRWRFRFFEHELDDGRRIEIEHARSKETTICSLLLKDLAKCWLQMQVQWRWEVRKAASCRPHYTATQQKPAHWRQHLREWGEDRHGLAALGDFQDLALLDAAQVHAQVLSQLTHRNLSPPGHVAHCSTSASLAPMPRRRWTQPLSLSFALPGTHYVRVGAGRTDATGTYTIVVTTR